MPGCVRRRGCKMRWDDCSRRNSYYEETLAGLRQKLHRIDDDRAGFVSGPRQRIHDRLEITPFVRGEGAGYIFENDDFGKYLTGQFPERSECAAAFSAEPLARSGKR